MAVDTEEIVRTVPPSKRRVNAFSVEGYGTDYFSDMPPEITNEILSYLILDHESERAARKHITTTQIQKAGDKSTVEEYEEAPHVLLSLAAMSTHFRDQVESFAHHHLITYKQVYGFKTTAERQELKPLKDVRRSERLKGKPTTIDNRCYRMELVNHLQWRCISCNGFSGRRAIMANGVACHLRCEEKEFPGQMTMSEAMEQYDLRDWMIIASREPGPRAKLTKADLPVITYGTLRTGKPYMNGMCTSYRVFRKDVEKVAAAVHGDIKGHMKEKNKQRRQRKLERRDREHRKLKIRYHQDQLAGDAGNTISKQRTWHQKRLDFYLDPNCTEGYGQESGYVDDDEWRGPRGYGYYNDIHRRLCINDDCDRCEERRMRKYCPWY